MPRRKRSMRTPRRRRRRGARVFHVGGYRA